MTLSNNTPKRCDVTIRWALLCVENGDAADADLFAWQICCKIRSKNPGEIAGPQKGDKRKHVLAVCTES